MDIGMYAEIYRRMQAKEPLRDIAKAYGISRERVRQIYDMERKSRRRAFRKFIWREFEITIEDYPEEYEVRFRRMNGKAGWGAPHYALFAKPITPVSLVAQLLPYLREF